MTWPAARLPGLRAHPKAANLPIPDRTERYAHRADRHRHHPAARRQGLPAAFHRPVHLDGGQRGRGGSGQLAGLRPDPLLVRCGPGDAGQQRRNVHRADGRRDARRPARSPDADAHEQGTARGARGLADGQQPAEPPAAMGRLHAHARDRRVVGSGLPRRHRRCSRYRPGRPDPRRCRAQRDGQPAWPARRTCPGRGADRGPRAGLVLRDRRGLLRRVRRDAVVHLAAAAHGQGRPARPAVDGRRPALRHPQQRYRRHAGRRHQRDDLRHARRAVPCHRTRALPRRVGHVRPARRGSRARGHARSGDERLDRPAEAARGRCDHRGPGLGRGYRRLRLERQPGGRPGVPRAGRNG